jgi:glucoamylase
MPHVAWRETRSGRAIVGDIGNLFSKVKFFRNPGVVSRRALAISGITEAGQAAKDFAKVFFMRIESYAMIGDCMSCALVGQDGAIDWLCLPRFDSAACLAALLGDAGNGTWRIAPEGAFRSSRAYRGHTLILETHFETATGQAVLIDFMVPGAANSTLVRLVRGLAGHVEFALDFALRFDYGATIPWVTRLTDHDGLCAIAGPDMLVLRTAVKLHGKDMRSVGRFGVACGQTMEFVLSHGASHLPQPPSMDAEDALRQTEAFWADFAGKLKYAGPYKGAVDRSLLTLKALSYAPTGGIVAAATTSLPEELGGGRNWDYRYCWLRDATLTLFALMRAGCTDEAASWRDWLHRSVAGSAAQIQIMYGLHGERSLPEREIPWLAGYEGSKPVRIGNAAAGQLQLDVFGEVTQCLHLARRHGLSKPHHGWELQKNIIDHLARIWDSKDQGIWESRGAPEHYTFSKIMVWVALDRMIKDATHYRLSGPLEDWTALRETIRARILRDGFSEKRNAFTQVFGGEAMDATLLLIPRTGFLPADDPRVRGTIAAVEQDLFRDGFVLRYRTESNVDGLPPGEGAFLACTFWLVDAYVMQGRLEEAKALFGRLLGLCNDVGLLAEEYDTATHRQVGNFPQAFSHVALVSAALALTEAELAPDRVRHHPLLPAVAR